MRNLLICGAFVAVAAAPALAQEVVVTQQLDDDLDLSTFALGSIGEANGNAAIMIEHIEKGPDHD